MRLISSLALFVFSAFVFAACTQREPAPAQPDLLVDRPAPGEVRAGRITDPSERLAGGVSEAQVGDWKMMNHEAVFTIADVRMSDVIIMNGGALLDADMWREDGENWDLVVNYAPLINGVYQFEADSITLESDGSGETKEAVIRVEGHFRSADILGGIFGFQLQPRNNAVTATTYYRLRPDTRILEVETVVYNVSGEPQVIRGGDALIPSDHYGMPFGVGAGFERQRLHGFTDLIGGVAERNEATFALMPANGDEFYVSELITTGMTSYLADLFLFVTTQTQCDVEPGETCAWTRYAVVGESPTRIRTEVMEREGKSDRTLEGKITGTPSGDPVAGARVFLTPAGDPTQVIDMDVSDAEGRFYLYPRGHTQVTIWPRPTDRGENAFHPKAPAPTPHAEGYLAGEEKTVLVAEVTSALAFTMPEPAMVTLSLHDQATKEPIPGKFTFAVPTETSVRGYPTFDETYAYGVRRNPGAPTAPTPPIRKIVWQAHAEEITIPIPPGTYDVYGSFGFAYELDHQPDIELQPGETRSLAFELEPAMDLTGWAQCDTHIHTSYSIHGRTSHSDRVVTLAAEGVDCAAITDHDRIFDFQPLVHYLGLEDRLFTFPGLEVSTFLRGHINPYPLRFDHDGHDGKFPVQGEIHPVHWWEGWSIPQIFERLREMGADVIQINHGSGVGGYFTMTGYDPETGKGGPEYSSKFDVLELMNGKLVNENVADLREIAFSLWDRGHRKTVVGVSDSHHRIKEPGYSRTFVRVDPSWHGAMDEDEPVAGLLRMDAVTSNGILVEMQIGGARYGETVTGNTQTVHLKVWAPKWIRLGDAKLHVNSDTVRKVFDLRTIEDAPSALRLDETFELTFNEDSWVALEVFGEEGFELWPLAPLAHPYAMTNPIFVDHDGNGWTPPRTPAPEGALSTKWSPLGQDHGHTHGHGHHHHHHH
jgi:hypothetical protein